jgi:Bacterial TniB protein
MNQPISPTKPRRCSMPVTRTTRMPSIAVSGDRGMGKSMIVGQFKRDDTLFFDARSERAQEKFLVVELSGGPGERRLYAQILKALGGPLNPRATIVSLEQTVSCRLPGPSAGDRRNSQHDRRLLARTARCPEHAPFPE